MSNTVITNYTDLNGPSTKADSSVVVIVNKDGSLSVDQNLLGTLMGTDGSHAAGISVVRVGHEGKPDDATDSESDDDRVPHVTLSVDSYYDEPNSIIKYDSGAEMLQSLRIETRENSLIGFQNDHCYTPFTSPSQTLPQSSESYAGYDDPVIEITHTPPPKPVPNSKKITVLEEQIITKGRKMVTNPTESQAVKNVPGKPAPVQTKAKAITELEKEALQKSDDNSESSSISSGDSIPDRDSDSDYKDTKDRSGSFKVKKAKPKPRILKNSLSAKPMKLDPKVASRLKSNKTTLKKEAREKVTVRNILPDKKLAVQNHQNIDVESLIPSSEITPNMSAGKELIKNVKQTPKPIKKDKKTPAHVSALLSDMTSLFSTPDVIRRVSTDNKTPGKPEPVVSDKKIGNLNKTSDSELKSSDSLKALEEHIEKTKNMPPKTYSKQKDKNLVSADKVFMAAPIPHLDDASLAQILQDTTGITNPVKIQPTSSAPNAMSSPGLAGPLSPTLDLLGGLQPEEEGLTEDLLMHVAQLVESSENLQEVIDKQVLGKVDTTPVKTPVQTPFQQSLYAQTLTKSAKSVGTRKDPIEIVRRDGRVITLPPIEAPATRSSKRKSQLESPSAADALPTPAPPPPAPAPPPPPAHSLATVTPKNYINKKLIPKKQEQAIQQQAPIVDKVSAESQESWNSEDDPHRLWCICKQPHNNRFMICCDGCEDWFHGKCVNITKAMGQEMEEEGIEWRCPNCVKKTPKAANRSVLKVAQKKTETDGAMASPSVATDVSSKTGCIVCKKPARASSIYCSDACILKHAQDSLGNQSPVSKPDESGKSQGKKSDSRVIVYERKTGRLLAGPNAPTAENLKAWLQKNPTFEVVRPGTLSTIKPNPLKKKQVVNEPNRIQTTLNFERIPRKSLEQPTSSKAHPEARGRVVQQEIKMKSPQSDSKAKILQPETKGRAQQERFMKTMTSPKEEVRTLTTPKTPVSTRSQPPQFSDTPKASTSATRPVSEPRRLVKNNNRAQAVHEKIPSVSPSTSRRKDSVDSSKTKMDSAEGIRDNVRKALQEQLSQRMAEHDGFKFSEDDIVDFAFETELELHELFRDVGMKYKAKYRSLMFNIKDRKNQSLWQKICDRTITPKQLVRLTPEELASQELAQWREKEEKHQLELIKKSELNLLAASKRYVLKTHKGEEVMENKESVSTELDPDAIPVEDVVQALNEETGGDEIKPDTTADKVPNNTTKKGDGLEKKQSRKKSKEVSNSKQTKKERRNSKRDSESRKSRSSRRRSEVKDRDSREERSSRRTEKRSRAKSETRDRSREASKEKTETSDRGRYRSRSRAKSKRRSKSREHSRSASQGRDRSRSRDNSKRKRRSRSKHSTSTEEKVKQRSRSQDNTPIKSKNDSTDSDSVERPKSATLKEAHPEYDPHEPMITSAFSEEDLRKSREDVYDDTYKDDLEYAPTDYDTSKPFAINANVVTPTPKLPTKQDKVSEAESDQEPTSTVENSAATVWNGCINMVDVARFYVAAHEVSGSASDLEEDLSAELDIVGRINPDTVWDYIGKMKRASNKDIVILRLQAANDEEKMQYIALYSYLSSRNRLGVVKVSNTTSVKDFYIVPLPAASALPAVLLPLDGPPLLDAKNHLLIAIVIRQRKRRLAQHIPQEVTPAKVARESRKRSYTPPIASKGSYTPPASPKRRAALPLPTYTSPALSTSVKDKIAASLACADDEEAYSPSSSSSGGSAPASAPAAAAAAAVAPAAAPAAAPASNVLRSKMEELNRQIEEQKQQIMKMVRTDNPVEEDEAYSPSRPMTPPSVNPLAEISLPSNLQEILATIKQRSEPAPADVDMRTMSLPE